MLISQIISIFKNSKKCGKVNTNRRNILKALALSPLLFNRSLAKDIDLASQANEASEGILAKEAAGSGMPIIPEMLNPGDKVAVVAPAGPSNVSEVSELVSLMKSLNINTELSKSIVEAKRERNGYLSNNDEERAAEFMHYIQRDDIKAIFAARGGYGVMRILDKLDYDEIANHPKIIVGYSDITALLIAIQQNCNIVTYHGPVASSDLNSFSVSNMLPFIHNPSFQPQIEFSSEKLKTIKPGKAYGRLTGGNLTMLNALLGTKYEIDTNDAIIFMEETHEEPYKVDRMLTQLRLAGKFDKCRGIIIGSFDYMNMKRPTRTPYRDYAKLSTSGLRVFKDIFSDMDFPIIHGFPFGHMKQKLTLPYGLMAEFSSEDKKLKIYIKKIS